MHSDCTTYKETPDLFCEPYIHTGFRPLNKPYSYYFKSIFTKHNETINAISHYIGALFCLSYFFRFEFSDAYAWPFFTVIITAIIMFVSSATAHLLHQKSHKCHMVCFLFDFTGISLHGFSSAFIQAFYCSPAWYYQIVEVTLVPFLGFMSMLCCLSNCFSQVNYKRPYPPIKRFLQFAPCGIMWIYTVAPLLLHFFSDSPDKLNIHYSSHLVHIVLFLGGATFFALDIPQRWFPGKFDFVGQGHHIFHVCIFFVVMYQIESCHLDFLSNYDLIVSTRKQPTFQMCFATILLLLIYDIFVIKMFTKMISHNFDDEGNLVKKTDDNKQVDNYKQNDIEVN